MTPTIDGADVSATTIDGAAVQEVTVDDSTVWNATPDSGDLQSRYDATELSLSDGDNVLTWGDASGNGHDLTAGTAPTYRTGGINGNPVVRFDGADDLLNVLHSALTPPYHLFFVGKKRSAPTDTPEYLFDGGSANEAAILADNDENGNDWTLYSGSRVNSGVSEDTNVHIFSALFSGSSSTLRLDGSPIASGDLGTADLSGLTLGSRADGGNYADFDYGEFLLYSMDKSSIQSDIENYLADKWGITI